MAYNYYPNYYQPQIQMNGQMPMQNQQQQMTQMSGFVSVRSEAEARNYPVAYGNSVTFKDETSPYIYTKTMGFSQLDRPVFDKYKLVKEEPTQAPDFTANQSDKNDLMKDTTEKLQSEIKAIWSEIEVLKKKSLDEEGA